VNSDLRAESGTQFLGYLVICLCLRWGYLATVKEMLITSTASCHLQIKKGGIKFDEVSFLSEFEVNMEIRDCSPRVLKSS